MKMFVLAFCLPMSLTAPAAFATSEVVRDPKSWDFAPLLYSDRIVRGTILSTTQIQVAYCDLHPELCAQLKDYNIPVLRVAVQVHEVLRGPSIPPGAEHVVFVDDLTAAYPIGVEMLLCEYYYPVPKTYYLRGSYGRYFRGSNTWLSEQTPRGQRRFDDADIQTKIASVDLEHVSAEAELIVEGEIQSVCTSVYYGPDHASAELFTLTLKVGSIEKGTYSGETIEIVALGEGMYLTEWRKHIPQSFELGQRWICWLKKSEIGWYPFAGTNGFLRIDDDALIYDERVPFWHSLDEVREAVRQAKTRP